MSAGYAIRPRPLDHWLRSLTTLDVSLNDDKISTLNQLALIAYFNGQATLANWISRESINFVKYKFGATNLHFAIQPWVNIGRIQATDWAKSSIYFRLPHYSKNREAPPSHCPIINWNIYSDDVAMMRFFWAVFITESAKAIRFGKLDVSQFIREIKSFNSVPDEFEFSILEIVFRHDVQIKKVRNKFYQYNFEPVSYRQQVSAFALESMHNIQIGKKKQALDCAISALYYIQQYQDPETVDPYLAIALNLAETFFENNINDMAKTICDWLIEESKVLNNEMIYYCTMSLLSKHLKDSAFISNNNTSLYFKFNPLCCDMSPEIRVTASKILKNE